VRATNYAPVGDKYISSICYEICSVDYFVPKPSLGSSSRDKRCAVPPILHFLLSRSYSRRRVYYSYRTSTTCEVNQHDPRVAVRTKATHSFPNNVDILCT